MTTGLQTASALMPASPAMLRTLSGAQDFMLGLEQISMPTEHILHGGMYTRTIHMRREDVLIGSLIKFATMVIINGSASFFMEDRWVELNGYNVIPGSAGRKQLIAARGPVDITMIFPTRAQTVAEAEIEVFEEVNLLMSRQDDSNDTVTITGE